MKLILKQKDKPFLNKQMINNKNDGKLKEICFC